METRIPNDPVREAASRGVLARPLGDEIFHVQGGGDADRVVIAFAGVLAKLGGIGFHEFGRTLASGEPGASDRAHHIAFVRELPPRWYNTFDPALLAPFLEAQAGREIVTLGNSMGGFAAILFSLLLPGIRRSITFCPQFSVHPNHCPWEKRWRQHVDAIDTWRYETCVPALPSRSGGGPDHVMFLGKAIADDIRHAEAILAAADTPAAAFLIQGSGHEVARDLRERAVLVPLFDRLIGDLAPAEEIAAFLRAQDVRFDLLRN
jgi:hypothetical protein